eukprot:3451461-Rhodomonas_salina.1
MNTNTPANSDGFATQVPGYPPGYPVPGYPGTRVPIPATWVQLLHCLQAHSRMPRYEYPGALSGFQRAKRMSLNGVCLTVFHADNMSNIDESPVSRLLFAMIAGNGCGAKTSNTKGRSPLLGGDYFPKHATRVCAYPVLPPGARNVRNQKLPGILLFTPNCRTDFPGKKFFC